MKVLLHHDLFDSHLTSTSSPALNSGLLIAPAFGGSRTSVKATLRSGWDLCEHIHGSSIVYDIRQHSMQAISPGKVITL